MDIRKLCCILAAAFRGLVCTYAQAEPFLYSSVEAAADTFTVYLDRADMKANRDGWLETAQFGIDAVSAEWERKAALLSGSGFNIDTGALLLENRLNAVLEQRFSSWLIERFFSSRDTVGPGQLLGAVEAANAVYLYQTENTAYVYDGAGDPLTLKTENAETDREKWREATTGSVHEIVEMLARTADVHSSELAGLDENMHADRIEGYTAAFDEYVRVRRRELEMLLSAEENRFLTKRMFDRFSLRKKNEALCAEEISAELIESVRSETEKGLEQLRNGLQGVAGTPRGGELTLDAEDWRKSFSYEFERGMNVWRRAEERLLRERAKWEQGVMKNFAGAESAWNDAYRTLLRKKNSWEAELDGLLAEGRVKWEQKENDLLTAIEEAREEVYRSSAERRASLRYRIENLVEMYAQSQETMQTAAASGSYWLTRAAPYLKQGGGEFASPALTASIAELSENDRQQEAVGELIFWTDIYETYRNYAETAERSLWDTFEITLNDGVSTGDDAYRQFVLNDSWEHCLLDDYQIELLRLKSLEEYWQKQLTIAEGVQAYAADTSSNRMTEAETKAAYQKALKNYRISEKQYLLKIDELERRGTGLGESRSGLETLQMELKNDEKELREAREKYTRVLDLYVTDNASFFRKKNGRLYDRLLDLSGLNREEEIQNVKGARAEMLAAARQLSIENGVERCVSELRSLLSGENRLYGRKTLAELEEEHKRASEWEFFSSPGEFTAALKRCFGLKENDEYFRQFQRSYNAYTDSVSENRGEEVWYNRKIIELLAADFRNRKKLELTKMKEAVEFLIAPSMTDWTAGFLQDSGGYSVLRRDAENAVAGSCRTAAGTELQALSILQSALDAEDAVRAAKLPGETVDLFLRKAEAGEAAYALALSAVVNDGKNLSSPGINPQLIEQALKECSAYIEKISAAGYQIEEQDEQECFTGVFTFGDGLNTSALLHSDRLHARLLRESRYETAERYSRTALHLLDAENSGARGKITALLAEEGCIRTEEEGMPVFSAPDRILRSLNEEGKTWLETGTWLYHFRENLLLEAAALPVYVRSDIREYTDELRRFFTLQAVRGGCSAEEFSRACAAGDPDAAGDNKRWELSGLSRNTKNYRAYFGKDFLQGSGGEAISWQQEDNAEDRESGMNESYQHGLLFGPGGERSGGDVWVNNYLETYNSCLNKGANLLESLKESCRPPDEKVQSRQLFYATFQNVSQVSGYFSNENSTETPGPFSTAAGTKDEYRTAADAYKRIAGEIEYLKTQIAGTGASLELYYQDRTGLLKNVLRPLESEVERLEKEYRSLQEKWSSAAEQFENSNAAYQDAYEQCRAAEKDMEEAAFRLEKIEALAEFATSGYLGGNGNKNKIDSVPEEAGSGQLPADPEERLEFAAVQHANIQTAFQVLAELYRNREPADFISREGSNAYREAFAAYRDHYSNAIVLHQLQSILHEATAEQERRVARARERTSAAMQKILMSRNGGGGTELTERYLEDEALRGWFDRVGALVQSEGDAFFARWGRAYWHRVFGGADADARDEFYAASLGEQWTFVQQEGISMAGRLQSLGEDSSAAMGGKEKEDFSVFLALTGLDNTAAQFSDLTAEFSDFLTERMVLDLNRAVSEKCAAVKEDSLQQEQELTIAAGAAYGLGVLFSWFPAICVPAFASSASLGIAATVMGDRAGRYGAVEKETAARAESIECRIRLETLPMREAFSAYTQEKTVLHEEEAKMKLLTAEQENGKLLNSAQFIDGIVTAGEIMGTDIAGLFPEDEKNSGSLKQKLRSLVSGSGYLAGITADKRGNSADMIHALAAAANSAKSDAAASLSGETALLNEARQLELQEYRHALSDICSAVSYTDHSVFKEAAEEAFSSPHFTASWHFRRTAGLSSELRENADHPSAGTLRRQLAIEQGAEVYQMFGRRVNNYLQAKETEWQQLVYELRRRAAAWEDSVSTAKRRGLREWVESIGRMESERGRWLAACTSEYSRRRGLWEKKYAAMLTEKNNWVREAAESASRQARAAVLRKLPLDAETRARGVESMIIPGISPDLRKPAEIAAKVLKGRSFASVLERVKVCNESIESVNTRLYSSLGSDRWLSGPVLTALRHYSGEDKKVIEKHIAFITAKQARQKIGAVIDGLRKSVASANRRQDRMFDRMLFGENFSRLNDEYSRESLVDDTVVTGRQYEEQRIAAYTYYEFPATVLGIDLSENTLRSLSAAGVAAQVDRAIGKIEEVRQKIFGTAAAFGPEGEFGTHVGETAECVDPDKINPLAENTAVNIKDKGSGESGRISSALIIYNIIQGRGWSEFNKPAYDKRLWDDDGSILQAPTIRGLVDIGTAVLVNAFAPGAGFLLNAADDALFAVADAAGGRLSVGEALLQMGKKTVSSAVTAGIGAGFNTVGNFVGNSAAGKAFIAGAKAFSTDIAGGIISAVELDSEGGLVFNSGGISEQFGGKKGLAGYASAMSAAAAGAALSGSLEGLKGSGIDMQVETVSALGGSAAALGVEYAITGEARLNVLNSADFLPPAKGGGTGLMELAFGGENGLSLGFGRGGTDVSFSRLAEAAENMGVWIRQQQIRGFDLFGKADFAKRYGGYAKAASALRSLWAYGDEKAETLITNLLSGRDTLRVGYISEGAHTAIAGDAPGRIIDIAGLGSVENRNSRLRAGIILQHEAWRDGIVSSSDLQFLETLSSAEAHTEMAMRMAEVYGGSLINGRSDLVRDAAAYQSGALNFAVHTLNNYDFSSDYWKLRRNGLLEYDGSGFLHNEAGELIYDDNGEAVGGTGIEGGLLTILGLEDTKENREKVIDMMLAADMTYGVKPGTEAADPANWYWNLGTHNAANMGKRMDAPNPILHYLNAPDHFGVLHNRGVTDLSYSNWTLGNAVDTIFAEIGKMETDLQKRGYSRRKVRRYISPYRDFFASLEKADNAFDMLDRFGSLSSALNGKGCVSDHLQVLFGDRLFRGRGGDMGLAEALRAEYNAREVLNYSGYAIQDIARSFTKMNIIYGEEDETGTGPGSVFKGNYPGMFTTLGYGDRIDFRTDARYGAAPALDCTGFTGLVYHAAGYLGNGENLNEGPHRYDGVRNIFSDERIIVADEPQVGDLIGMEGHIGFLGEDGNGGRMIIHSAPDPAYTGWNDLGHKKSGPREDSFTGEYMHRLGEAGLFEIFAAGFGGNYGRWKPDTLEEFRFGDDDLEKFYSLF